MLPAAAPVAVTATLGAAGAGDADVDLFRIELPR